MNFSKPRHEFFEGYSIRLPGNGTQRKESGETVVKLPFSCFFELIIV